MRFLEGLILLLRLTKTSADFKRFVRNKLRVMEGIKSIEPLFVADDEQEEQF